MHTCAYVMCWDFKDDHESDVTACKVNMEHKELVDFCYEDLGKFGLQWEFVF